MTLEISSPYFQKLAPITKLVPYYVRSWKWR